MLKRIIASILICTMAITTIGCTGHFGIHSGQRVSAKDLRDEVADKLKKGKTKSKYRAVQEIRLNNEITGVMLKNWRVITFDSTGADFDFMANTLSATDLNGSNVLLNIDDVRDIYYANDTSKIFFNKKRGFVNIENQKITGITVDGDTTQVKIKYDISQKIITFQGYGKNVVEKSGRMYRCL